VIDRAHGASSRGSRIDGRRSPGEFGLGRHAGSGDLGRREGEVEVLEDAAHDGTVNDPGDQPPRADGLAVRRILGPPRTAKISATADRSR